MKRLGTILLLTTSAACLKPSCAAGPARAAAQGSHPVAQTLIARTLTLDDVDRLVWKPGANATFTPTTLEERAALALLVTRLVNGARAEHPPDPGAWQAEAADAGFSIELWQVDGQSYWALVEPPERRRGAGAYVFRVAPAGAGEATGILLQAPHADHDVGTGMLAAQLFFFPPPGPRPRAFFTNTIHRYQSAPGQRLKQKNSPSDVAHNPEHGFVAATLAFARALGGHVLVIQLHGFAGRPEEDDDVAAPTLAPAPAGEVAMVVSAADKQGSSPRTRALAAALARAFGAGVKRFPEDVSVLGATTNVEARALRGVAGAEFVHIEMSAETRKMLASDPERRQELGTILFGTRADDQ